MIPGNRCQETGVLIPFGIRCQETGVLFPFGNRCQETRVSIPFGNRCRETGVWIPCGIILSEFVPISYFHVAIFLFKQLFIGISFFPK